MNAQASAVVPSQDLRVRTTSALPTGIPEHPSPSAAGLRVMGLDRMLAMLGSHPRGDVPGCFGWRMEVSHLQAAVPRGRRRREPGSALGELLVRREREEAASSQMALTLSASQTPSTAPTLGLALGPAETSPATDGAPEGSRE